MQDMWKIFLMSIVSLGIQYTHTTYTVTRQEMVDHIFREYDIRGIVGKEFFIEDAYDLARAIVFYDAEHKKMFNTAVLARDARTHSPEIYAQVLKALYDSGLQVIDIGICPSPALYFAVHTKAVDGGFMVTASHNPPEYNGLKLMLGTRSLWGKDIQEIKKLFHEKKSISALQPGSVVSDPIVPVYVAWLVDHFPLLHNIELPFIIDCGNGAAGAVIPFLVEKMGWKNVQVLYPELDGTFPHHEADPTVEKNMADVKKVLQNSDALFGFGFDGDGDRVGFMTKDGYLIPGDRLLGIFAQNIIERMPGAGVVYNVLSSSALIDMIHSAGGRGFMVPAGHSIIEEEMQRTHAVLGGEISGHFFFHDRYFGYDDGIYAALRMLEILVESGQSLEYFVSRVPKKVTTREYRIPCPEDQKKGMIDHVYRCFKERSEASIITIDGLRITLPYGWGVVRPSNTQAVLSVRFESDTQEGLMRIKKDFFVALEPYLATAHELLMP